MAKNKVGRKEILRKALWELLKKRGVNKKFDYNKIVPINDTKGELHKHLKGDWEATDKTLCWDIMQEGYRKDKTLNHIGGPYWTRLK